MSKSGFRVLRALAREPAPLLKHKKERAILWLFPFIIWNQYPTALPDGA